MRTPTFTIKNIRSFVGEWSIALRPLVFIYGKNSAGKSTVLNSLVAFSRMTDREKYNDNIDRNAWQKSYTHFFESIRNRATPSLTPEMSLNREGEVLRYFPCTNEVNGPREKGKTYDTGEVFGNINFEFDRHLIDLPPILEFEFMQRINIVAADSGELYWSYRLNDTSGLSFFVDMTDVKYAHEDSEGNSIEVEDERWRPYDMTSQEISLLKVKINGELNPFLKVNEAYSKIAKKAKLGAAEAIRMHFGFDFINRVPSIEFRIRDSGIDLKSVGTGVCQLFPSVFACLQMPADNIGYTQPPHVCIRQPETHLHPSLQCELADFYIEAALNPDYKGRSILIESHSEHLLLRVMRRVRESNLGIQNELGVKITPKDVAIYYVDQDEQGRSSIRELRLDDMGRLIDDWPGGFFEEGLREVLM